jgi:hypothetical protein
MSFDLQAAIDIHVHADPSLFPRWGDGHRLAEHCRQAGMSGFVLKSHHGSSVEVASAVAAGNPDLCIAGGLALNHFVGGLNPAAVDAAVALGAKIIWLPTIHAAHHVKACGVAGGFSFQKAATSGKGAPQAGISIVDASGNLVSEMREILAILDGSGVVLASGHISCDELSSLHSYVRSHDIDLDILVNHVRFFAPRLDAQDISALVDARTWFEVCFFSTCSMAKATTVDEVAALLLASPDANWIIASDAGQEANPAPPEALSGFCAALLRAGVAREELRRAIVDRPMQLLKLSAKS